MCLCMALAVHAAAATTSTVTNLSDLGLGWIWIAKEMEDEIYVQSTLEKQPFHRVQNAPCVRIVHKVTTTERFNVPITLVQATILHIISFGRKRKDIACYHNIAYLIPALKICIYACEYAKWLFQAHRNHSQVQNTNRVTNTFAYSYASSFRNIAINAANVCGEDIKRIGALPIGAQRCFLGGCVI